MNMPILVVSGSCSLRSNCVKLDVFQYPTFTLSQHATDHFHLLKAHHEQLHRGDNATDRTSLCLSIFFHLTFHRLCPELISFDLLIRLLLNALSKKWGKYWEVEVAENGLGMFFGFGMVKNHLGSLTAPLKIVGVF